MLRSWPKTKPVSTAPVAVMVAATAMIAIKCISILLIFSELGLCGTAAFLRTNIQGWEATLIFIVGLLLICLQIRCGFVLIQGHNWGRWCYIVCQCVVIGYLLLATIGDFLPEVFTVEGESNRQILHTLILQKIPDVVIVLLLFLPSRSRHFFAGRK